MVIVCLILVSLALALAVVNVVTFRKTYFLELGWSRLIWFIIFSPAAWYLAVVDIWKSSKLLARWDPKPIGAIWTGYALLLFQGLIGTAAPKTSSADILRAYLAFVWFSVPLIIVIMRLGRFTQFRSDHQERGSRR
jgi:hypothetical protein